MRLTSVAAQMAGISDLGKLAGDMQIIELHRGRASGEPGALGAVAHQKKTEARIVPKNGRRIEDGIEPVRHAMGAHIGRDEPAFETGFALDVIGTGGFAGLEQAKIGAVLDDRDLLGALAAAGDVRHKGIRYRDDFVSLAVSECFEPFEHAGYRTFSHGADGDDAFRPDIPDFKHPRRTRLEFWRGTR